MAPATTSPIKILSDLGYEVWEMESDADMLRALVDAINSLDPSDGRIPILQDAVKEIRGASRVASPSKGMKITEKKTRINASKFIPKAKPTPKPRANPVALLPPAQEDNQPIFSTLLNGLKNKEKADGNDTYEAPRTITRRNQSIGATNRTTTSSLTRRVFGFF